MTATPSVISISETAEGNAQRALLACHTFGVGSGATPKEKRKKRKISNLLKNIGGVKGGEATKLLNQFFVFSVFSRP